MRYYSRHALALYYIPLPRVSFNSHHNTLVPVVLLRYSKVTDGIYDSHTRIHRLGSRITINGVINAHSVRQDFPRATFPHHIVPGTGYASQIPRSLVPTVPSHRAQSNPEILDYALIRR